MATFQPIGQASDRVMAALVAGLELEFGHGAAEGLAQRFLAAEECDLTWEARVEERWIGAWESEDEDGFELDRVEILGRIDGRWFVAVCIVDGEGKAHGMMGKRRFSSGRTAREAFRSRH